MMAPKLPISKPKSYSIFIALVTCTLLMTSCGAPTSKLPSTATSLPPGPTPGAGSTSTRVLLPSSMPATPVETLTAIPSIPTPVAATSAPTAVPPSPMPLGTAAPAIPAGSYALAPGTTAGVLAGTLTPGQVVTYTIGAGQFQPMTLIAASLHSDVTLGVSEQDGNILLDPALKHNAWQMVLPVTGLYTIQVIGGATTENYALTVKLPQVVNLASGAASTTLTGRTVNGFLYSYALNFSAGQILTVSLNVPSSTATIDIYGLSTGTLLPASAAVNTWSGTLAQTEGYVIEVVPANGQVVDFSLSVSVTAAAAGSPAGPGTIIFDPGMTAAVVQGSVQAGQVLTYTLQADAAQPLILIVDSPKTDVTLGVLNPDGSMLLSPDMKWSHWQWQLPSTGLYTIQVIGGKAAETFTLTVKLGRLVYFSTEPKTVTLHGNTYPGYVVSYAFRLSAGLNMTVKLDAAPGAAYIDIFGVATGSLLSFRDGATSWSGTLPETQEYVVEVVPRHGASVVYSLTVSIP